MTARSASVCLFVLALVGCESAKSSATPAIVGSAGFAGMTANGGAVSSPMPSGGSGAAGITATTNSVGMTAMGSGSMAGGSGAAGVSMGSAAVGVAAGTAAAGNAASSGSGAVADGHGGSGGAGGSAAGSAGAPTRAPTGENTVAYIGCSMAYNVGTGYKRVGGKVMWNSDSYQTGAMVVQNWTNSSSSSWSLFDRKMQAIGGKDKVKAIMVQICIFSSRASDDEVKSMIAAARAHTNPGTHIYLVGQPQYEAGHECMLAGNGGAKWTDDEAQKIAADTSVNQELTYLGQFKLDSTKGEVMSDSCHATPSGEDVLGKQAMAFFGG